MIEIAFVKVDCPYCGMENKLAAERFPQWWAASCDGEMGGCNRIFIYKTIAEPRGIARKVEGEG
jgi:hypothetical protein